jgi:hypothetical protein
MRLQLETCFQYDLEPISNENVYWLGKQPRQGRAMLVSLIVSMRLLRCAR